MRCPKCKAENTNTARFCSNCATPLSQAEDRSPSFTETLETPIEELSRGALFADRYEIIEELGRGGMGTVYRVEDTKAKEEIALKLIKPEISVDKKTIERFRNELTTARKIRHQNICGMYDINEVMGTHYITMEYVPGEDLKSLVKRVGRLDSETAIKIARQISIGLNEAHKQRIIHRDLKPSNIMIDKNGDARIMDFGIARTLRTKGITGAGVIVGTSEYMSPEQAEAKEIDQRSDIYSLGIILYEITTGRLPFEGDTPLSIALKHKTGEYTSPNLLNPQIPDELNRLIIKCLQKNANERFQTTGELLQEIEKIQETIPATVPKLTKKKTSTSRELTVRFKIKKASIASIFILLLIAAAAYFVFQPTTKDTEITPGTTRQITHEPGLEIDPAISPDGKMMAFASGPIGKMRIYVGQVSGGRPLLAMPDFPGNQRCPRWSPDGNKLTFFSEGSIYIVQAFGGVPRRLIKGAADKSAYGAAWSPDGENLAYVQDEKIHIFQMETGESQSLVEAPEAYGLDWSPDGTKLAYVSGNLSYLYSKLDIPEAMFPIIGNFAPSSIFTVTLAEKRVVRVTDDEYINVSPFWVPNGSQILYISSRGGTRDVYAQTLNPSSVPSGQPIRLTTGINAHTLSLSQKGQKLVYSVFDSTSNIMSIEISEEGPVSVSDALPVTIGNQIIESLDVSFDGQWLLYDTNLDGNANIYKMPLSGGESIQLTQDPNGDFAPRWSPNGEEIVFHSFRGGNRDVFSMNKDGGAIQQMTFTPSHEFSGSWSWDGSKIKFDSDMTGRLELYVISRNEEEWGKPEQVTFNGGSFGRWSPDRNSIAFISNDSLKVISLDDRKTTTLVERQPAEDFSIPRSPEWSRDGKTIFYFAQDGLGQGSIWAIPRAGGKPELKVIFDRPNLRFGLPGFSSVKHTLYFTLRSDESDVWIMDLFIGNL
jgi:serine/threonine protein kinase